MRIALEVRGEGTAVLLLHGTPSTWDVLRPVATALADRNRTLLAAHPGYGESPPWTEDITLSLRRKRTRS